MTNTNKNEFFSLSTEELAMAMGLINQADKGHNILATTFGELSQSEVDARLTSASHSLLAHGLCTLSNEGTPILNPDLEKVLFPLAKFDYLLQVSIVSGDGQAAATIYVQKKKQFTSHSVQLGVIHVLEHGAYQRLPEFLADALRPKAGKPSKSRAIPKDLTITPAILGGLLKQDKKATQWLSEHGWTDDIAQSLISDIAKQSLRGTLIRVQANENATLDSLSDAERPTLLSLAGKKNFWVFDFPSSSDEALGTVDVLDLDGLAAKLSHFAL